ncbi:MAG: hypothetical protein LBL17_01340 [Coxiellaceae bacterium]|jgi:intracellular multiplication protein IcmC|nr:hypothetical protein [Coxiellaceae bacterium]
MLYNTKFSSKQQYYWIIILTLLVLPLTSVEAQIDWNTMLNSLKSNAGPIIRFIVATSYVIGLWFIISAVSELKKVGQSSYMQAQQSAIAEPLVKFIVGLLLLYLPTVIDVSVWTIWGHTAMGPEGKSYMEYIPSGGDPFGSIKAGSITIVRVVGYVSFVRGLIMLSRTSHAGSQPGTFGKGIIHMVGGILAINIVETIRVIGNTLGFVTI